MSKQFGVLKLDGRMGDVSFYSQNGVHRARLAKGVKKERILKDPAFERTRQNISEFGGLALAVKLFGDAVKEVSNFRDKHRNARLRKRFNTIMKRADIIRGERPVLISQNRDVLENLELKSDVEFGHVFQSGGQHHQHFAHICKDRRLRCCSVCWIKIVIEHALAGRFV